MKTKTIEVKSFYKRAEKVARFLRQGWKVAANAATETTMVDSRGKFVSVREV